MVEWNVSIIKIMVFSIFFFFVPLHSWIFIVRAATLCTFYFLRFVRRPVSTLQKKKKNHLLNKVILDVAGIECRWIFGLYSSDATVSVFTFNTTVSDSNGSLPAKKMHFLIFSALTPLSIPP